MSANGARSLAVVVLLAGCGSRAALSPAPAGAGGQPAPSGGAGGGAAGGAGGAGGTPTPTPTPTADAGAPAPTPAACDCARPGQVDILACGSHQAMTSGGFDAPYAVMTPDGQTVVFNRCVPGPGPGDACTLTVFRWTRAEGATQLATDAWAVAVAAQGHAALLVRGAGGPSETLGLWRDGQMIDVPLTRSAVQLLSDDGTMVVGAYRSDANTIQAARWTAASGITTLGDLPGGPVASWPNAMTADASVVVGYGNTAAGQEPFRWAAPGGPMIDLGVLQASGASGVQASALGISADGSVTVGSSTSDGAGVQYFRWTAGGGLRDVAPRYDAAGGGLGRYFLAWSPQLLVSADGVTVAGTMTEPSVPLAPGAFMWTADRVVALLTPGTPSIVRGMSARGDVILGSKLVASVASSPLVPPLHTPFIWRPGEGAHDLVWLLELIGADLSNLILGDPIALSADGQMMVGQGTCGGAPVIYRLSVPALSTGP